MSIKALQYSEIVERIYNLSLEDKEEMKNLLEHNIAEERRNEIAENYRLSRQEEKDGKLSFTDNVGQSHL